MVNGNFETLCIYHILDGLRDGLSHFSGPSRAALIYAVRPEDPLRVYDPQNLLRGHEPRLKEFYFESEEWRKTNCDPMSLGPTDSRQQDSLQLSGLITYSCSSQSFAYQMWFTEQHPDMCSVGPTRRWLEYAVWLLSQDIRSGSIMRAGTSGHVLQSYSAHAVRDYIVDERSRTLGLDTYLRIYPVLDAVLGISGTREEGRKPYGRLVFIEPCDARNVNFIARFPELEQPALQNHKHVRKLLQAVEGTGRRLVSDGISVLGIASGPMPAARIVADFQGGHGYLRLENELVCSFSGGSFHSTTRRAKLVQLEEALLEYDLDQEARYALFRIVSAIVHSAEDRKHGCTIVVDPRTEQVVLPGQTLTVPLDLAAPEILDLAKSLSSVDGALHIGVDLRLHGFACLLDGLTVPGENRARGARFNSALRFTAVHPDMVVVVVSSDRPVSVMQGGVELTATCEWKPVSGCAGLPPTLWKWLGDESI